VPKVGNTTPVKMAESWQQTEDQNMEAAGEETYDNAEQADQSWEDNSKQDWDNSNQDGEHSKTNGWEDGNNWKDKRRGRGDHADHRDEDEFILEMEKKQAIKIIGKAGSMVKEIGKQSRAFIKIDPDVEPASIRIAGTFTAVDRARAMIHDILHSEYDKPRPGDWSDEMYRKVTKAESAKIIGSRGSNIQYIEKKTWAKLDANEQDGGMVMVRVTGDFDAVENALTMMSDVLNNTGDWSKDWGQSKDWGSDSGGGRKRKRFQDGEEPEATEVLHFEASFSGSIVGRNGVQIKKMRDESGAEIDIQKIENDEKCEVTIKGSAEEVELGKKLVEEFVAATAAKRQPREGAVTETLEFEKRAAKEIIGRGGRNIKEVRETSGADIKVGDDWDKCVVTITGIPEQISIARQKIEELAGAEAWKKDEWKSDDWNSNSNNGYDNKDDTQSEMTERQQRFQQMRQALAKPPPPSGQIEPYGEGNSDDWNSGNNNDQWGNSGDWKGDETGPDGNSKDLGSAASVIGMASAKSPPAPKAPLPTGRPPPSAIMKAPGGWPNIVPPKFGGLDALCDNLQSGPDFGSLEPHGATEVMGAALMKAPPKANVVPAKLGGIQPKGKGKGGNFQPMQSFSQPGNSDSWGSSEDWQSGDADSWQQEEPAAPSAVAPMRPMQVPARPAGPNFGFTQPAADDWNAGGGDNWQSGNAGDFNSGQGDAFMQPAAVDDWGPPPAVQPAAVDDWGQPQQRSLHPQPEVQQLQQEQQQQLQQLQQFQQQSQPKPKFSWLQDDEQPAPVQQVPAQQPQFSWLQNEEQPLVQQPMMPAASVQQFAADAQPADGWGGWGF